MSTRILDIELTEPLPDSIDTGRCDRLLIILWSGGAPVGTREIRADADRIDRLQLAAALGRALGEKAQDTASETGPAPTGGPCEFTSAVVCTCRRPAALARCLEALSAQNHPNFEILCVDNDPAGSAAALVQRCFPAVHYVAEPRSGVRYARNRGIAEGRGEVIAFIDDDCIPVPGWLRALAGNFRQHPHLGCCTGPVLPAALDTSPQEWLEQRGGFNRGFSRHIHTRDSGKSRWRSWPLQAWMFGSGGNMAFRRSVLSAIGPFDELLPTAEDLDMFFRVVAAGYELIYEPAAAVRHHHVSSYRALRRRLYLWGWGYVAYLLKIACDQPAYRKQALAEIAGWLPYQLRDRLWRHLRHRSEPFPLSLILAEIAGGLAGIPGYLRVRAFARGSRKP